MAAPTVSEASGSGGVWDNRRMTPRFKTWARSWAIVLMSVAALLGLGAALLWRYSSSPQIELATGTYLASARAVPDFSLIDQRGAPFGPRNLGGHWSLMFFGYTNCPDFCPTTLVTLAAMEKNLRRRARDPAASGVHLGRCPARYAAATRQVRALLRSDLHRRHRRRSAHASRRWRASSASPWRSCRAPAAATPSITRARFSWSIRPARSPRSSPDPSPRIPCRRISIASWPSHG